MPRTDFNTEDLNTEDLEDLATLADFDILEDLEDVDTLEDLEVALNEVQRDLDAAREDAARVAREVEAAWSAHEAVQDTQTAVQGRAAARADLHATAHAIQRTADPASAPEVVRARLVWYADKLATLPTGNITSKRLADYIGNTAEQVRKDLNNYGAFGRRGVGYDVATLRSILANLIAGTAAVVS